MDLCWDRAVVQTSWPLKINHAGLMPRALSERKSGLEVRQRISEITFFMVGRVCHRGEGCLFFNSELVLGIARFALAFLLGAGISKF